MKWERKTLKFLRNVIIGIIALIIVAFIVNITPGYRRNKYENVINLVIGEENVTEKLINPIYKDEEGYLYLSFEDIKNLLDKTLYYEQESNLVIATSEVSVGSMKIGEKQLTINGATVDTLSKIIYINDTIYIPIKEMKSVYNIDIKYIGETNVLVIDKLNRGMIKAEAKKETTIRYKQRSLSKKVGTLVKGETVSAFYTTSKGWRQIRTETGIVGYVKANTLTNEYIVRQDMNQKAETKTIPLNCTDNTSAQIDGNNIVVKDLYKLTNEGILLKNTASINENESIQVWSNLTIGNTNLKDFNTRNKLIKNIISLSMKNNIKGINIIVTSQNEGLERFIIEIAPRLREIGIKTNIVKSDYMPDDELEKYKDLVDYIIK